MQIIKVTIENFAKEVTQSEIPVLVDIYADWCGPCKMLAPELEAFAQETQEVKVCKLNVDESSELAMIYGVLSVPTLLLFKDGKEIARHVGGCEKEDIVSFCNNSL